MSRIVAASVIRGAKKIVRQAEDSLNQAISQLRETQNLRFPGTAFYLPMAYALMGIKAETLRDSRVILEHAKSLLSFKQAVNLRLAYFSDALEAGLASLLAEEIIMALRYLYKQEPQRDCDGFFADTIMRSLGIRLVDGRMSGVAVIMGAAPDNKTAVKIVRQLQEKNILIFVGSNAAGRSIIDQLIEKDVQIGWDNHIVAYGRDTFSAVYPLNWAIRVALNFGGLKAGQLRECLLYTKERVLGFSLILGELNDLKYATAAGIMNMGFPVIADTVIPQVSPCGITTYGALTREPDRKKIVRRAIEIRGIKVSILKIPIPVAYAAAFEGERVRKEQLFIELGRKASLAFEYVVLKESEEVDDGRVEVIGSDIDQLKKGNKSLPLAISIEVFGIRMQRDFEPVLERQIHRFTNYVMGITHIGQRDTFAIRISRQAYGRGFRLKHLGLFLHAMFHKEYGVIVDKIQVKLYTRQSDVERLLTEARKIYHKRDERLSEMTDEGVDTFYGCTLCQSFAPNHVCIVAPERLGLCGAYSWLDAKASYEIMPTGPNQPIIKGRMLDGELGQWQNINDFVYEKSNKTINRISMYSLMDTPQTSCGCFECIVAIIPEANGFMIVNRDYSGMTPCGMTFTSLAGLIGTGVQTPGFLGIGKSYILSKKFISADGGLSRIVWMPKELKKSLNGKLKQCCHQVGQFDLLDKIADEGQVMTLEQLLEFLAEVGHPVLSMPDLL